MASRAELQKSKTLHACFPAKPANTSRESPTGNLYGPKLFTAPYYQHNYKGVQNHILPENRLVLHPDRPESRTQVPPP